MLPRLLFRVLASPPPGDHVPDAELLRRFATTRDTAALELVVRRHANAVWATCRRLLRSEADAEDAFQATFLALVRRARAVRTPCAGGWLHRVAVNASLKLRERTARVSLLEPAQLDAVPEATPPQPDDELSATVHRELDRLSERERLAIVLCDLEGLTHAEAAKVLECPIGTLSGRLSRAHAKLRDRLTRRGVATPLTFFSLIGAPTGAVSAAVAVVSGTVSPSPTACSLTEGVLVTMRIAKLKLVAAVVAATTAIGLAGVSAHALTHRAPAATPVSGAVPHGNPAPPAAPQKADDAPDLNVTSLEDMITKCPIAFPKDEEKADPKDDKGRQLLKAMATTAREELQFALKRIEKGVQLEPSGLVEAAERVFAAVIALDPERARKCNEERVRIAIWQEKVVEARVQAGRIAPDQLLRAHYTRLKAELTLYRSQAPGALKK